MRPLSLLVMCVGCGVAPEVSVGQRGSAVLNAALPEAPALMEDVALVDQTPQARFARPHIPPYRTTRDGRVGVDMKKVSNNVGFYLFTPEKATTHWRAQPAGVTLLASNNATLHTTAAFYDPVLGPPGGITEHRTICDGWPNATRPNPYPCAADSSKDCYDVTIVSGYPFGAGANKRTRLYGRQARISVSNPKTANARIDAIVTNEAQLGLAPGAGLQVSPDFVADNWFEPTFTEDGRLMVARIADTRFTWVDPDGDAPDRDQVVDIVYGVAEAACDVSRLTAIHPISHAPYDDLNDVRSQYTFAEYPFRDPEGTAIEDGVDLHGSYPWIDRRGTNVFFSTTNNMLYGGAVARYTATCVEGLACVDPPAENDEDTRSFTFAGLWTHGRMVQLDGLLNNTDYGLGRADLEQRSVALYDGLSVRVGTGRDNGNGALPAGATPNTAFLDSPDNRFNHDPDLFPATVRDVVWIMNSGKHSQEVAFDDYIDPNAIILSDMVASMSHGDMIFANQMRYHDGFDQIGGGFTLDVRVQNAATSITRVVPAYGAVLGGARIEPVALGGIHGKGLWLDGDDRVEYAMSAQAVSSWYLGVFVDTRAGGTLVTFPNGAKISLRDADTLFYTRPNGVALPDIALPAGADWRHLGFAVDNNGRKVTLLVDGYPLSTHVQAAVLFALPAGTLTVGAGFRGWIDELKLLAYVPVPEVMCNHARGTLRRLDVAYAGAWAAVAAAYPAVVHESLARVLGEAGVGMRYVCAHDYGVPQETLQLLSGLESGTSSVRAALLQPAALAAGAPRPDESANAFCLSCHVVGAHPKLSVDALVGAAVNAEVDPRRQPMQPPARVYGVVPVDYYGAGVPGVIAPVVDGLLQDLYLLP